MWNKRNFHFLFIGKKIDASVLKDCLFLTKLHSVLPNSLTIILLGIYPIKWESNSTLRPEKKLSLQICFSCITMILGKVFSSGVDCNMTTINKNKYGLNAWNMCASGLCVTPRCMLESKRVLQVLSLGLHSVIPKQGNSAT